MSLIILDTNAFDNFYSIDASNVYNNNNEMAISGPKAFNNLHYTYKYNSDVNEDFNEYLCKRAGDCELPTPAPTIPPTTGPTTEPKN